MKEFINKNDTYLKIIGILIGIFALADTQMDLLLSVGFSPIHIKYMKLAGLIFSLILPSISSVVNGDLINKVGRRPRRKPRKPRLEDGEEFEMDIFPLGIGDTIRCYTDCWAGVDITVTNLRYTDRESMIMTLEYAPIYNDYESVEFE